MSEPHIASPDEFVGAIDQLKTLVDQQNPYVHAIIRSIRAAIPDMAPHAFLMRRQYLAGIGLWSQWEERGLIGRIARIGISRHEQEARLTITPPSAQLQQMYNFPDLPESTIDFATSKTVVPISSLVSPVYVLRGPTDSK